MSHEQSEAVVHPIAVKLSVVGRLAVDALYCSAFPLFVLSALAITKFVDTGVVPRYDAVLMLCVAYQIGMLAFRIETPREFATIFLFHAMGTALEMFKVNHGGWYYPEPSWIKVMGVPLYSGFMYASVGSFILACWKRFDVRIERFPAYPPVLVLVIAVYVNFFTNYWLLDAKPVLLAAAIALFARTWISGVLGSAFNKTAPIARSSPSTGEDSGGGVSGESVLLEAPNWRLSVPLPLVFCVLGPIVWCAENVGTWLGSWEYPRQVDGWVAVPPDKLLSWTVLVMVSFLVVALVRRETIQIGLRQAIRR